MKNSIRNTGFITQQGVLLAIIAATGWPGVFAANARTAPATEPVNATPALVESADDAVAAMAHGLANLDAVEVEFTLGADHPRFGALGTPEVWLTFYYTAPGYFYLAAPDKDIVWVHDKQGTRIRSPGRQRYWESNGPVAKRDLYTLFATLNTPPDVEALIEGDHLDTLQQQARQRGWLRDETAGNASNEWTFIVNNPRRFLQRHRGPVRMVVDRASGLVRYVEALAPAAAPGQPEPHAPGPLEDLLLPTTARLAAHPLRPSTNEATAWPAVAGADGDTRVGEVEELFNRSPGSAAAPSSAAAVRPDDTLPGQPAPVFSVTLLNGERWHLQEQRGNVVVIDFWATWCGPCVRALPSMKQLAETFAGQDVVFLGLSRDRSEDADKARQVLVEHGITYANALDAENLAARYQVRGIPNVLLIDRDGIVRSRKIGLSPSSAKTLEEEIRMWLTKETTP